MNLTGVGLAERNDARVKPVHQSAERQKVQFARPGDVELIIHLGFFSVPASHSVMLQSSLE
jgi:hypothetical protein